MSSDNYPISKYAEIKDVYSEEFKKLNKIFSEICKSYNLTDHSKYNRERFSWATEFLSTPEQYASRLWEYPWAILSSNLSAGMKCADIGCGESAFTIFLKQNMNVDVTGFDKDFHSDDNENNFGISDSYLKKSGIHFIKSSIENINYDDNSFDRIFCLSVFEHIEDSVQRAQGMQEIARILKPGGLAIITVDVNLQSRLTNPLELVWESGLNFIGKVDLNMPRERFGIFCDGKQPADVFGLVLVKEDKRVNLDYGNNNKHISSWEISKVRDTISNGELIWALKKEFQGYSECSWKKKLLIRLKIALKLIFNKYPRNL